MSDHSLQKAGKKRLEFRTIHHQKRERRCFLQGVNVRTVKKKKSVKKTVKALAAKIPNEYRKFTVNNCITELHTITVKIQSRFYSQN